MNKNPWFPVLLLVTVLTLVTLIPGCAAPSNSPSLTTPVINTFTASPPSINPGQQFTLNWTVSNADTVNIQPQVGIVGLSGSLQLSPAATITYTLTATSPGGSTNSSVTVSVAAVAAAMPDLVITDLWLEAQTVYYKIKNQGGAGAGQSTTTLYLNNLKQTTGLVEPLAAGQEITTSFTNWEWPYQSPIPTAAPEVPGKISQWPLKACADTTNAVAESNENNNCLTVIIGQLYSYDFVQQAHLAEWRTGTAVLTWPMFPGDPQGGAYLQAYAANTITMCPQQIDNGWIRGTYADFYFEPDSRTTRSRLITVPPNCRFTSQVGFAPGSTATGAVTVAFGYTDNTGNLVLLNKITVTNDGQRHDYQVDLSQLEGAETDFVLWVQANGPANGACVTWVEPMITENAKSGS